MVIKILIIVFLITILYSLGSAMIFLVKDHGEGDRTVKRLTWRIGLSLVLFLFLWAAYSWAGSNPTAARSGYLFRLNRLSRNNAKPAIWRASLNLLYHRG